MTQINWGLAQGPNAFDSAFEQGFQLSSYARQRKEEKERQSALAQYATNPTREGIGTIAKYDPEFAIRESGRFDQREAQSAQRQQADMGQLRRLLEHAGDNPQEAYAAAQQMGIDLSNIPQPGAPEFEPWRQQQLFIFDAMEREPDAIPGIARELQAAGIDITSPEGEQALRAAIESKYASTYMDRTGATRQRSIFPAQQRTQTAGMEGEFGPDMWRANVAAMGRERAVEWAVSNGIPIPIEGDADYNTLPSGSTFRAPDGTIRRKP